MDLNMKTLTIGASGFVGGVLHRKLSSANGYTAMGTYKSRGSKGILGLDVLDKEAVDALIACLEPDVVIWSICDMQNEPVLTNIGLENLLSAINRRCTLVYFSTNVFGGGRGGYSEDDALDYVKKNNHLDAYAQGKIAGENKVKQHENHMIIRPGVIYGQDIHGQWDKRMSRMISAVKNHEPVFLSKNNIATWVTVDFIADAVDSLLRKSFRGVIHLGTDEKESGYTMNCKIARQLGLDTGLIHPVDDGFTDNAFDLAKQHDVLKDLCRGRAGH